MSEIGDTFDGWKEARQEKRAANRTYSANMLTLAGYEFSDHNDGAHLQVAFRGHVVVDFWPGTGLWHSRDGKVKRRGVVSLLKYLGNLS